MLIIGIFICLRIPPNVYVKAKDDAKALATALEELLRKHGLSEDASHSEIMVRRWAGPIYFYLICGRKDVFMVRHWTGPI
jgi:hypothetical protein